MMNNEELLNEYKKQVDELLNKPNGLDMFCWLRRRTSALLEHELVAESGSSDGWDEIGSSDVSCKLFEVWRECYLLQPRSKITDSLGFQINSRVQSYIL